MRHAHSSEHSPPLPLSCEVWLTVCCVAVLVLLLLSGVWSCVVLPPSAVWFLVCCHSARDVRCGNHGPPLLAAMSDQLTAQYDTHRPGESSGSDSARDSGDSAALLECSHLNGHRYAAICVAIDSKQLNPQWYGCVREKDAPLLISVHGGAADSDENDTAAQQWVARHRR